MDNDNVPPEFLCPITKCIMVDPVIFPQDGHTYEREAIAMHLSNHPYSPLTNAPMKIADAKTNYSLKSLIEKYMKGDTSMIEPVDQKVETIQEITFQRFTATYLETNNQDLLNICIKPNDIGIRPSLTLIAMIDVSGSMGLNACKNVSGFEDINLSRLQLVQHSLKTIVNTLTQADRVIFIEFDDSAHVILELTIMDEIGKQVAIDIIDNLQSKTSTNIWDALRVGIQEAQKIKNSNVLLLLFTDGEPNINPPMGIVPSLREHLCDIEVNFTISTFSFGYMIDSVLLKEISQIGNGVYGYCPDPSMVGTVFINYISNVMTTLTQYSILSVKSMKFQGNFVLSLYLNKERNVFVELPSGSAQSCEIVLNIPLTNQTLKISKIEKAQTSFQVEEINNQVYRKKLIDLIKQNLENPSQGISETKNLFKLINSNANQSEFMKKIKVDLIDPHPNHGQVGKSFEPEYFKKWGKDYLRSFLRFHELEQCGNFKDESLQQYSTPQFALIRKTANKIFMNLPAPKAKEIPGRTSQTYQHQYQNINMQIFNNYGGGCFSGDCLVELQKGVKKVKDIEKGDILLDGGIVVCLIETVQKKKKQRVVNINGAKFTPYHPILQEGNWIFPIDVYQSEFCEILSWFNLVLSGNKIVRLNGIQAITLGHQMKEGILHHPYFGTQSVIDALKKHDGFEKGKVLIVADSSRITRDENGLISSYF
jgi:Mg-chelatase subunit ChlD